MLGRDACLMTEPQGGRCARVVTPLRTAVRTVRTSVRSEFRNTLGNAPLRFARSDSRRATPTGVAFLGG